MFHVEHYACFDRVSRKFQGDELCILLAGVGHGIGDAALDPAYVPGLELNAGRTFALDVAAQIQIAYRDEQLWSRMMMLGNDAAGVELELRGAHAVFHEKNILGAPVQDVQAAVFVPLGRRRLARLLVLQKFDGDIAEGLVGEILCDVGEPAGEEPGFAILQRELDRRLSRNLVFHDGRSQGDEDVVVAVTVHERGRVGRDFHLEHAHVLVFERQMMTGLGRDLNFRRSLGGKNESAE